MAEDAVVYRADHAVITNDTFPDAPCLATGLLLSRYLSLNGTGCHRAGTLGAGNSWRRGRPVSGAVARGCGYRMTTHLRASSRWSRTSRMPVGVGVDGGLEQVGEVELHRAQV
jgi:hypothetical protein